MSKQEFANGTVIRCSGECELGSPNQSTSANQCVNAERLFLINQTSQNCRNMDSSKHCHKDGISDLNYIWMKPLSLLFVI